MIEASLKAGYYNAVSNEKAITKTGGMLLTAISAFVLLGALCSMQKAHEASRQLEVLQSIEYHIKNDAGTRDSSEWLRAEPENTAKEMPKTNAGNVSELQQDQETSE